MTELGLVLVDHVKIEQRHGPSDLVVAEGGGMGLIKVQGGTKIVVVVAIGGEVGPGELEGCLGRTLIILVVWVSPLQTDAVPFIGRLKALMLGQTPVRGT